MTGTFDWEDVCQVWQTSPTPAIANLERRVRSSTRRMRFFAACDVLGGVFGIGAGLWFILSAMGALWYVIGVYLILLSLAATAASLWLRSSTWQERGDSVRDHLHLLIERARASRRLVRLSHGLSAGMTLYTGLVLYEIASRGGRIELWLLLTVVAVLGSAFGAGAIVDWRKKHELSRLENLKSALDPNDHD